MPTKAELEARLAEATARLESAPDGARSGIAQWVRGRLEGLLETSFAVVVSVPSVAAYLWFFSGTGLADMLLSAGAKMAMLVAVYSVVVRTVVIRPVAEDPAVVAAAKYLVRAGVFLGLGVVVGLA